ncbi:hypothetical protein IR016_26860 [Pseudomonas putida]|uniref:hypothetical protein n=1 Tax=Pseudomonas putida TaxID=303 RepID=UPI0018A9BD04|nr:hypothetical protein [Pseudomonas putida]MBF8710413.1 hypothetical protein [Pseudomonas putida]
MQQRKVGATIFDLQVAPLRAISDKSDFLLLFGAKSPLSRIKRTEAAPFKAVEMVAGRVAPFP